MTLEQLLDDASIADDLEINFGDKGKYKVADLRAHRKGVKEKQDAIAKELLAAENERKHMDELATKAAEILDGLKKETPPPKDKNDEIDFDTDPVYGPLVTKKLKPLEAQFADVMKKLETAIKNQSDMATFYLHDYYARRFNEIPADRRPKDKTWKDYLKVAAEKKIMNEFGMPDPFEAWQREQEPIVLSEKDKTIQTLTAQVEELKKQANAPRMPRPGSAGKPGTGEGKTDKTFDSVDALVDAAFADPLIQEIAAR